MENNLKPSVGAAIFQIFDELKKAGLSDSMIIDLIQKRTKLAKRDITRTLDALVELEREILRNRAKYNKI